MRSTLYPAMLTPLTERGEALDEAAFLPMIDYLLDDGADGLFVLGTTGEGINLRTEERKRVVRLAKRALGRRGQLLVHCGAQSTQETVALAADAATVGVDGVAVIPPPYYSLDERELLAHLEAAAAACSPTPFYVYAFSARSGYPVPVTVIEQLRDRAPNLAGLKVSESPLERVTPFLNLDLPVYIGNEPLIPSAMAAGKIAGSVSAVASVFPETMRLLLDHPTNRQARVVADIRTAMSHQSLIATAKVLLAWRGVPIRPAVRAPLRALDSDEAAAVRRRLSQLLPTQIV